MLRQETKETPGLDQHRHGLHLGRRGGKAVVGDKVEFVAMDRITVVDERVLTQHLDTAERVFRVEQRVSDSTVSLGAFLIEREIIKLFSFLINRYYARNITALYNPSLYLIQLCRMQAKSYFR